MTKSGPTIYPEVIADVKTEVPTILYSLRKPLFVTRGIVEDALKARGISMPGHDQYFSRIVNNAIVANGYEGWSNLKGARRYKTYKRIEKKGRIGAEGGRLLLGSTSPVQSRHPA